MKFTNIPRKLWEHKKKSAFLSFAAYFTGWKIYSWKRNCDIRATYAREAKKFGDLPLPSSGRLRRVAVLVDTTCAGAFDSFKKNALPLFNLAGLQVDIIKPNDISELKTIARHIDTADCDALYVIGGDSSLSIVLSALCQEKNNSPVPIGVFPGESDSRSLVNLVSNVFGVQNDIRPCCESAMALIEEQIRPVYLSSIRFENGESNADDVKESLYGISGLHVGWYDRIEASKDKLWYWGGLKRWIAYVMAYLRSLKQYPEVELNMVCVEYCAGCCKCRSESLIEETKQQTNRQWWHYLIGSPNYPGVKNIQAKMDYSAIQNENCGKIKEMKMKAVEIAVENVQDQNACNLRVRTGGSGWSRINLLMNGWRSVDILNSVCIVKFLQGNKVIRSFTLKESLFDQTASHNLVPKEFNGVCFEIMRPVFFNNIIQFNSIPEEIITKSVKIEIRIHDRSRLNIPVQTPSKGSKGEKKEMKRLPKVDEELHVRTIFEPVAAEIRPAKGKPKIRSKLKWKEIDIKLSEKTNESKQSSTNSDKAIRLQIKANEKQSVPVKVIANEKSEESANSTDKMEQSIIWMIIRGILDEILIGLIIIIIIIFKTFIAH